jgi:hypothetical protein
MKKRKIELSGALFQLNDIRQELDELMTQPLILTEEAERQLRDVEKRLLTPLTDEQEQRIRAQLALMDELELLPEFGSYVYPDDDAATMTLLSIRKRKERNQAMQKDNIAALIKKVDSQPVGNIDRVSPDILKQFTTPPEDISQALEIRAQTLDAEGLEALKDERGTLLFGEQTGLQGGNAFFERFTLAIAQQVSRYSTYFGTEDTNSGMPVAELKKYVDLEKVIPDKLRDGQEGLFPIFQDTAPDGRVIIGRTPIIGVNYEFLARDMYGREKGADIGGKEKKKVREKIAELHTRGGYYKPLKGGGYVCIPYLIRYELFNAKKQPYGCILFLSPDFSSDLGIFVSVGTDALKKLSGDQKSITFNLFFYLAHSKPNGKKGNTFSRRRKDLQRELTAKNETYRQHPDRLESDFSDALRVCKETGIIEGYREYTNKGGERIITFIYEKPKAEIPPKKLGGKMSENGG